MHRLQSGGSGDVVLVPKLAAVFKAKCLECVMVGRRVVRGEGLRSGRVHCLGVAEGRDTGRLLALVRQARVGRATSCASDHRARLRDELLHDALAP